MESHPLAEKYDLLEGDEYESFKADIAANGCLNPVWTYQRRILDGRNRYRACQELGIEPAFAEFDGTEEQAAEFVDSQNFHRRHLSAEWRREQVKAKRAEGKSTRQIAKEVGVGIATVHRDLNTGVPHGTPDPDEGTDPCSPTSSAASSLVALASPPKVTGRDGKQYAATKPQTKASTKPTAKKTKPDQTPAEWQEVVSQLKKAADLIESAGPIPEEMKPWQLVESLETTARALLKRASQLRRRHKL